MLDDAPSIDEILRSDSQDLLRQRYHRHLDMGGTQVYDCQMACLDGASAKDIRLALDILGLHTGNLEKPDPMRGLFGRLMSIAKLAIAIKEAHTAKCSQSQEAHPSQPAEDTQS